MKNTKKMIAGALLVASLAGLAFMKLSTGGQSVGHGMAMGPAEVKVMQVVQRDTTVNYEFVGKVTAKNEVKIISKVSGNIVDKMVKGGDVVYKGQPLFKVDNRQYQSAINTAQANLNKSQAALRNTQRDVDRYRQLAAANGIARQTVDSYEAQAEEEAATVAANRASLQQAMNDEQDTLILSPVDGRIDVNEVSVGQFVAAGSTVIATVSSSDPIWVQFSMSENEYIRMARLGGGMLPEYFKNQLKLVLSDGSVYALTGSIEQIDKGINDTTGTIIIKASFANPQKFLIPGMFAKVVAPGELRSGALLIPQRAVKEMLDETFVTVVTADNKAESRRVKMGERIGNMWLVQEGLAAGERIVVEGIDKARPGMPLNVTMIVPEDLQTPAKK